MRSRWLVAANALLLLVLVAIAVGVEVSNRPAVAVEASVRRYAVAITNGNLDAALQEIAPDQRAHWSDWIAGQVGNTYDVRGIAVRTPPLSQGLRHQPTEVTVVLDVDKGDPDQYYQPTTRVPIEIADGRPYLATPLIEPEADAATQ